MCLSLSTEWAIPRLGQLFLTHHTSGCVCVRLFTEWAIPQLLKFPMSHSTSNLPDHADAAVENADWRKQVEDVLNSLTSSAAALLDSFDRGDNNSAREAIEEAPVLFSRLQELEKLQQSRLDDINRCHDQWRSDIAVRTRKLGDLDEKLTQQHDELRSISQKVKRQQDEANKVGRELGSLATQRMDAFAKLVADREASERHERHTRQEDLRIDGRSNALDARQRQLDDWQAAVASDNRVLTQDRQVLVDMIQEELKREDENEKRSAKVTKRLDVLTDYQAQKDRQVADYASRLDNRNQELSTLRTVEAEKAKLNSSLIHLSGVILPQKEAELTGSRAELAKMRTETTRLEKDLTSRISGLNARVLSLEGQVKDQINQLSQLDDDKSSLQRDADKRAKEVELTETKLTVAQATITSLTSQIDRFRKRDVELQTEVENLRPCRIDFNGAKRLQDVGNAKIRDLEQARDDVRQERDSIHRDRDSIRQELEDLKDRYERLSNAVETNMRLQGEAATRETQKYDVIRHRCEVAEQERYGVTEENIVLRAQGDRLNTENQTLSDQYDQLSRDHEDLMAQHNDLKGANADLEQEMQDTTMVLSETEYKVGRLTEQLQSCHCSGRRSSRKRPHDQVDYEEEESSSMDEADRAARRKGKAPESRASHDAAGSSGLADEVRDSASPELSESRVEDTSRPTGPGTSRVAQLMNTTAARASGSANPTITPSDSVAFTISVKDATLMNFSSDVLPTDVLQTLRNRFQSWSARSAINWTTVQSSGKSRSCIEARLTKHKSEWNDGSDYACALCERRMRLCVVVDSAERVLLLPRKAAEDEGRGPTDTKYWAR